MICVAFNVHQECVSFSFNFSSAAQELQKEAARDESTDGNTTSQSSKSSVVHTAKKPARRGGKQGKPSRSARTPKNRRAMANKTGSTQIRRDDIGTCVYMYTYMYMYNLSHSGALPFDIRIPGLVLYYSSALNIS